MHLNVGKDHSSGRCKLNNDQYKVWTSKIKEVVILLPIISKLKHVSDTEFPVGIEDTLLFLGSLAPIESTGENEKKKKIRQYLESWSKNVLG